VIEAQKEKSLSCQCLVWPDSFCARGSVYVLWDDDA